MCILSVSVECNASTELYTSDDLAPCDIACIYCWLSEEGELTYPI